MIPARQLAMGPLDFIRARVARDAEDIVIIAHSAGITLPCSPVADIKECPLCGETMRFTRREQADHIPGMGQTTTRSVREWICPECDYWEEAEGNEGEGT
jgi:uncharacterized protein with PIN domain